MRFIIILLMALLVAMSAIAAQREERVVVVGSTQREYIVYFPDDPKAKKSWPVLIAFHPALGTGKGMEGFTKLHEFPEGKDFVIVYPDGIGRTWNDGVCCGEAAVNNVDDIGFFKAILTDLKTVIPTKPKAYITGWSNGARLTYRLLCDVSDHVAAAAPFGATFALTPETCRMAAPVPIMHMHGIEDKQSPIIGGPPQGGSWGAPRVGNPPPPLDSVKYVADHNGCSAQAYQRLLKSKCLVFNNCTDNATATYCPIAGLGHLWPGMESGWTLFGPAREDVQGSQEVLRFFLVHVPKE